LVLGLTLFQAFAILILLFSLERSLINHFNGIKLENQKKIEGEVNKLIAFYNNKFLDEGKSSYEKFQDDKEKRKEELNKFKDLLNGKKIKKEILNLTRFNNEEKLKDKIKDFRNRSENKELIVKITEPNFKEFKKVEPKNSLRALKLVLPFPSYTAHLMLYSHWSERSSAAFV